MCQWKFFVLRYSAKTSAKMAFIPPAISVEAFEPRSVGVMSGERRLCAARYGHEPAPDDCRCNQLRGLARFGAVQRVLAAVVLYFLGTRVPRIGRFRA